MYSFSIRQFIWEYIGLFFIIFSWMFGPNFILMLLMFEGGLLIRCQHYVAIIIAGDISITLW